MPFRIPPQIRQQLFSTSSRARTTLPSNLQSYTPTTPHFPLNTASTQKLGRVGRWYLPTIALIAVGMAYVPVSNVLPTSSRRTSTLDSAKRQISFDIVNALQEQNLKQNQAMTQEEKNMMLLNMYGEGNSLEDLERAVNGHSVMTGRKFGQNERNKILADAYGERKSLKDMERALEVYEVQ